MKYVGGLLGTTVVVNVDDLEPALPLTFVTVFNPLFNTVRFPDWLHL